MKTKKAQIWGLDLIIAVFIFSIGIVVFLIYSINYSGEAVETFEKLNYDGEIIMKNILSDGSPQNWNESNVIKIGILSNNKVNETKLKIFYNLTKKDYHKTKLLLNTKYDFYFFINEGFEINEKIEGIGTPNATLDNINSNNLIRTTRFGIYRDKPTTFYLYVWEWLKWKETKKQFFLAQTL